MSIANLIIKIFLIIYTNYFLSFFSKKSRSDIQCKNKQMNKLRKISIKTIEEQKKFLELRYPKRKIKKKKKFKFSCKFILKLIWNIILFGGLYYVYGKLLDLLPFTIQLWQAILVIMLGPIIINLVLNRFNLQKNDISVFFK